MPIARPVRLLAVAASVLASAACSGSPDDDPPVVTYSDSAELVEPEPASGSSFLDPNLATAAALTALPGMSDAVTLAVIAGRPYSSMLALDRVLARHLTEQWRDSVYTRVWIPLDLNTASSDEIMLIPGVDARERLDLEEYRPYDGIDEFRRDIGEQLGPEEAARIERYVTLP